MNFKIFVLFCLGIFNLIYGEELVKIPEGCAGACPPGQQKICARNSVTKQLGEFESECIFGRYNSCTKTVQRKFILSSFCPKKILIL
jgi:hypothetical protein